MFKSLVVYYLAATLATLVSTSPVRGERVAIKAAPTAPVPIKILVMHPKSDPPDPTTVDPSIANDFIREMTTRSKAFGKPQPITVKWNDAITGIEVKDSNTLTEGEAKNRVDDLARLVAGAISRLGKTVTKSAAPQRPQSQSEGPPLPVQGYRPIYARPPQAQTGSTTGKGYVVGGNDLLNHRAV
ncbi:hypothetical protein ANO11243_009540 [Dothideomycetidae sp. 11243]|nr:hypothetical protein ANO11243_009540 [fungal sp. No.11243]